MILPELPDSSRVWVYTANRELMPSEQSRVLNEMAVFTKEWKAHGAALSAGAAIIHNRYLILAADESAALASGCSIDASVRMLKAIGSEIGVDFFARTLVTYREADQASLTVPMHEFWALRKALRITDQTEVFNATAKSLGELRSMGWQPFAESWHAEMWR